jgi:C-terminal processing protease CtpA/Prc
MQNLNRAARMEILEKIEKTVAKNFYDPKLCGVDWPACVRRHRDAVADAETPEAFERSITELLSELKSSHMGFFHHSLKRASSKMALSATYASFPVGGEERWVFQDVHEGGAADLAGLRPGDIILSVDGRAFLPPEHPIFPMGQTVKLKIITRGEREEERVVDIPSPKRQRGQLPYASPKIVSSRLLSDDLGLIKISMFPGVVGIDVANEISAAVATLKPTKLIIDLRGNTGGGIGVLRVMSLLTRDRVPVGYSLSRKQFERGLPGGQFSTFDRIPSSKLGLVPLILKFARPKLPIMVTTEGLGLQPFHGNVVLLVNRHTASAN